MAKLVAYIDIEYRNFPTFCLQGVTYFLQNVVQNDIGVGMVMFNSLAFTLRSVSKMSNATRQQFIDAVPTSAGGGTSIGAGGY